MAVHAIDHMSPGLAKVAPLETIAETDQADRWAADVLDMAIGQIPVTRVAGVLGVSEVLVRRWRTTGHPFLRHMHDVASRYPAIVRSLGRALVELADGGVHVARPLPERVCSCLAEVGDVAREIHMALADGTVDEQERARIRREIAEAREELDRLERDLG